MESFPSYTGLIYDGTDTQGKCFEYFTKQLVADGLCLYSDDESLEEL